ncbi:MAG: DUF2203 domain-containing protein [Chloroflexota bacterium]
MRTYDLDTAAARIREAHPILVALRDDRARLARDRAALAALSGNDDASVAARTAREAEVRATALRMQAAVTQLAGWSIALRDIPTGLIDLPALVNGVPVWLCWRLGEPERIDWWHAADDGFAGRRPIAELPGPAAGARLS